MSIRSVTLPSGLVVKFREPGGFDGYLFLGGLKRLTSRLATGNGRPKGMAGPSMQVDDSPEEQSNDLRDAMIAQGQRVCDLSVEPKLTLAYPAPEGSVNLNEYIRSMADYAALCKAINDAAEEAEKSVRPLSKTSTRSSRSTRSG